MARARRPRSVYAVGEEPDARFSLANERTFLAGIRTGLALLAAGIALEALDLPVQPALRFAAALLLTLLGALAPLAAWRGWTRDERAIRLGAPLPAPALVGPLTLGVSVAGSLLLVGYLVGAA